MGEVADDMGNLTLSGDWRLSLEEVKKGEVLLILEAMKMENNIIAARDATISELNVELNQLVEVHFPLVVFEEEGSEVVE